VQGFDLVQQPFVLNAIYTGSIPWLEGALLLVMRLCEQRQSVPDRFAVGCALIPVVDTTTRAAAVAARHDQRHDDHDDHEPRLPSRQVSDAPSQLLSELHGVVKAARDPSAEIDRVVAEIEGCGAQVDICQMCIRQPNRSGIESTPKPEH
jgi:hypothetical protein